jgi:dihydrofolate reductase
VDELQLFIVPVILGEGIPLFTGIPGAISLHREKVVPYRTGIVKLEYLTARERRG